MAERPRDVLVLAVSLNKGGAERFVSTLLVHLDRAFVRPSLVLLRADIGYPLPPDVPTEFLGYESPWRIGRVVERLRRYLASAEPEVVVSNGAATSIVAGLALSGCAHQPAWIARVDNNPRFHDRHLRHLVLDRVYPRARCFVANSHGLRTGFISRYPFSADRVQTIYNPVDFERIEHASQAPAGHAPDTKHPVILSVGRLFPQKRLDVLIDAFSRLQSSCKAELWICGDGPERTRLEQRAASSGCGSAIRFLGHRSNPYPLMRRSTLFVLASDYEGLPNALIEAQGLGLPAVSTKCPYGPGEIIADGETGLLVETGDVVAMARAMDALLGDAQRRHEMGGLAARRMREMFDADARTRDWERILETTGGHGSSVRTSAPVRLRANKRRCRLLIVSPSLSEGGSERFASRLACCVDRATFEPHMCLMRDKITYPLASDVPVHNLDRRRLWHTPRTVRRLGHLLEMLEPDVVLGTLASVNRLIGATLQAGRLRARWIARFVADPVPDDGLATQWLTRATCMHAHCFVANSTGLQQGLARFYPFMHERIHCIHNPVDFVLLDRMAEGPAPAKTNNEIPVVISVGRLAGQKRPDVLLDAFAGVLRRTEAQLWMVGTGASEAAVRQRIGRLGLEQHVRMFGFVNNPHVLMKNADVFALTSDYEGLPNSLIEAQGLGLPAVSTRCPYGPEEIVVPGETGILTNVGDVTAFSDGLVELLQDPERRREMGQRAREVARSRFDARRIIRDWEKLIGLVWGGA